MGNPVHLDVDLPRAILDKHTQPILDKTLLCCEAALKAASLQISDIKTVLMVGGSSQDPFIQNAIKKFFGRSPVLNNPVEAVGMGAAIQAGILSGDVKEVMLLDVCPLSLGIEANHGVFAKIIEGQSTIPTTQSQIFTTAADNQEVV